MVNESIFFSATSCCPSFLEEEQDYSLPQILEVPGTNSIVEYGIEEMKNTSKGLWGN